MADFTVSSAEVSWLRVPFEKPIQDSTHTLPVIDIVVLELEDDAGRRGTGYLLGFDYATAVLYQMVLDAARSSIGTDTRLRNQTWQDLWTGYEYIGHAGVAAWGVSIVDLALWDLYGQQTGQPVWALLGGARPSTPAYGSGGWLSYTDAEVIAEAESYRERGLGGYKMKVGRDVDSDIKRVRAVRTALGDSLPLMIDANQRYDLSAARRLSDALADCGIRWLEEPMPPRNLQDYVTLRATTSIPLALGEREYYPHSLSRMITERGVDVIMPDALRIGGVRGWQDLASMATAADLAVAPHFYREYDTTLAAATSSCVFVENFFWTDPIFHWEAQYRDGRVSPPDAPGFGIRLKEDARSKYLIRRESLSNDS